MKLEVASPAQLYVSMIISVLLLVIYVFALSLSTSMLMFYLALLCLVQVLGGLILTHLLLRSNEPLLTATPEGLKINSLLSMRDVIPWEEIGKPGYYDVRIHFITIPRLGQLRLRFKGKSPFRPILRYLLLGWFGITLLPARLAKGGGRAADQFCTILKHIRTEKAGAHYTVEGSLRREALWSTVGNITLPADMKKLFGDGPIH